MDELIGSSHAMIGDDEARDGRGDRHRAEQGDAHGDDVACQNSKADDDELNHYRLSSSAF